MTYRIEMLNLDGQGHRRYRVYAMLTFSASYWLTVTDVPCPVTGCKGTIRWYEAGYVPGYRICDHCRRHFLAKSKPTRLVFTGDRGCFPEQRRQFAVARNIEPPTTMMDVRFPHESKWDTWVDQHGEPWPIPQDVRDFCRPLFRERNTCSDERVEEIDRILLHVLRPWTHLR